MPVSIVSSRSSFKAGLILGLVAFAPSFCGAARAEETSAPTTPYHDEKYRPQFHFTADTGWMNDPNGLVFDAGEWHLFYQHNPNANSPEPGMCWGHALSTDLVHWRHLPEALKPNPGPLGKPAGCWSGSGLIDLNNSAGFQTGKERPIILAWTSTGVGQCIAFSNDRGRTFTPYAQNPVLPMDPPKKDDWDRDPKVYWHEPTHKWVMAISISNKGVTLYSSPDLKHWTKQSLFPGLFECPDYFQLPVDDDPKQMKWVIWDASGKYFIGRFDGTAFTAEAGPYHIDAGHNYYAAQTWNNAPDARRISIAWMRDGAYPGMPFNQQMGIPSELKLRTLPEGIRLTKLPVKEVEQLRYDTQEIRNQPLEHQNVFPGGYTGDLLDIEGEVDVKEAGAIDLNLRGVPIQFASGQLHVASRSVALAPVNGRITFRILVDRTSIEVFGNNGAASISLTYVAPPDGGEQQAPTLTAEKGRATLVLLRVHKMHSAWERPATPGR